MGVTVIGGRAADFTSPQVTQVGSAHDQVQVSDAWATPPFS